MSALAFASGRRCRAAPAGAGAVQPRVAGGAPVTMSVHHSSPHATVGVDLGEFRCLKPHQGLDKLDYFDLYFSHGRMSVDAATWLDMLHRSQEEIVAAQAKQRIRTDLNISGARVDFGSADT